MKLCKNPHPMDNFYQQKQQVIHILIHTLWIKIIIPKGEKSLKTQGF
jgi:hypothetical protein